MKPKRILASALSVALLLQLSPLNHLGAGRGPAANAAGQHRARKYRPRARGRLRAFDGSQRSA